MSKGSNNLYLNAFAASLKTDCLNLENFMSKYKTETSKETIQQAEALAKGTQRPGQTKEQTKLIAQGIQKGIEQYKKQQKSKARELDKKLKTVKNHVQSSSQIAKNSELDHSHAENKSTARKLPWLLLVVSWISFSLYIYTLANT